MNEKISDLLKTLPHTTETKTLDTRNQLKIYKTAAEDPKIFLIIQSPSDPIRFEVRTGKDLTKLLTEKYESIMRSNNMSPSTWVEVITSGQLTDDEYLDLIRTSYYNS
jgi:predicted DNA-binding protein (MmcQ/YjbR family)